MAVGIVYAKPSASSTGPASASSVREKKDEQEADPALRHRLYRDRQPDIPGLTIDSHRQFPKLTNAEKITPAVSNGKDVWHKYNCINCHTLFGEGAYYAPDLTKITKHRGEQYLQA